MRILQLESSNGWGGQEIRTLKESQEFKKAGHEVIFAITEGGLSKKTTDFKTYTLPFKRFQAALTLLSLIRIILKHKIDQVHTHSSWDSWIGGVAAKLTGCRVVRTRHLSTPIREGLNSRLLYNSLADIVITTCEEVAQNIQRQAKISRMRCLSIPTGVDPLKIEEGIKSPFDVRKEYNIPADAPLIGSACILRSWKGLMPLLEGFAKLDGAPYLIIIGEGPMRPHLEKRAEELGVEKRVIFTGFLQNPFPAIDALDIFALLSSANEGVSQAVLQAAYLKKPLLTTTTGGLDEVCLDNKTGRIVPKNDPQSVSLALTELLADRSRCQEMGRVAKELVENHFLWKHTFKKLEEAVL